MTATSLFRYHAGFCTFNLRVSANMRLFAIYLLLLLTICGCANKQLQPYIDNYANFEEKVYVIDHGYHTALAVESKALLEMLGLQDSFYRKFKYIEIGRGDAGFYQQEEIMVSTTLKALFFSTPAIMYLRAYNTSPMKRYPAANRVKVRLSRVALGELHKAIVDSFALEENSAVEMSKGPDEFGRYFKARGNYHLFYTCNNWTAEIMQQADYPINHRWAFFAGSVMRQIDSVKRRLETSCRPTQDHGCPGQTESATSR